MVINVEDSARHSPANRSISQNKEVSLKEDKYASLNDKNTEIGPEKIVQQSIRPIIL